MTTQNKTAVVTGASAGLGTAYAQRLAAFPEEWIMSADGAVDAALAGLAAGEPVTIPSLPEISDWESFENMRQTLVPNLSQRVPADRCRG
ncbi:hypothetical protein ACF1G5_23535 [Streptomyces coeruleorubidus]|uniref:hypothetical protein n=1 Tax=Streptomyces coeruleorubidus TaxID=116188 RepID=UPI0036F8E73B